MAISLSRKADYALIALAYMAERGGHVCSAREITEAYELPGAMVMQILKGLQHHGVLSSTRGVKGGYRIAANLDEISVCDLIGMMECRGSGEESCGCLDHVAEELRELGIHKHGPVQALQLKLRRFLGDVKVSELVVPGRRIDVPLERVRMKGKGKIVKELA